MPHPIAHPAASVPFARGGMVFSALVIGSVAPDFGYLVPLPTSFFMYTLPGLFLFDMPMGLILLWLFQLIMKWPLLSLLPIGLQHRLFKYARGFCFGPFKHFLWILLSLLVGSLTHVILDSFTHRYLWGVEHFPLLRNPIGGIPLYAILQNGGTVLGIGLLVYWFFRWLPTTTESDLSLPHFSNRFRTVFFMLMALGFAFVEAALIYWRLIGTWQMVGVRFLIISVLFSAVIVTSAFIGVYCLLWLISFHKTVRGLIR